MNYISLLRSSITNMTLYKCLFIFSVLLCSSTLSVAQEDFLQLDRAVELSQKDGLNSNKVIAILKDSKGFIWIGTHNGLNLYDGHQLNQNVSLNYINTEGKKPYIRHIYEDSQKRLWVSTDYGLFLKESVGINFQFIPIENESANYFGVGVEESKNGDLYFATQSNIYKVDVANLKLQRCWITDKLEKQNAGITALLLDKTDKLWVGTWENGLYQLDLNKKEVLLINELNDLKKPRYLDQITCMTEGPNGNIWVGAYDYGLWRFNANTLDHDLIAHDNSNQNSINSNLIKYLTFDPQGYLWIGLEESGLDRYSPEAKVFSHLFTNFQNEQVYESYSVYSIYIDDQNMMWLGFRNIGLKKIPLKPAIFSKLPLGRQSENSPLVLSIIETKNTIWSGVRGGIESFDLNSDIKQFYPIPDNKSALALAVKDENTLILGTYTGELFEFNKKQKSFQQILPESRTQVFENGRINTILKLDSHSYLVGSKVGTFRLNLEDSTLKLIYKGWGNQFISHKGSIFCVTYGNTILQYFPETGKLLKHTVNSYVGVIRCAAFNGDQLYFGSDYGLYAFDLDTNTATKLTTGLEYSNEVNALISDNNGNLWYSSVGDIHKYNIDSKFNRSYDRYDGLPVIRFKDNIVSTVGRDQLLFGGEGGAITVDYNFEDVPFLNSELVFTSLTIAGDSTSINNIYNSSITTEELVLNSSQNNLSINYSLLSYYNNTKQTFEYQLDDGWINIGNQTTIDLIDLQSGSYNLSLRSIDEFGIKSDTITLPFYIKFPIWLRWYSILFYVLVVLFITTTVLRYRSKKLILERDIAIQNYKTESIQEKSLREMEFHELRLKFFTNISHEIRTPLTLIIGPLEKFVQKGIVPSPDYLELMFKNAQRLKRLTTQILDFRKMESNKLQYEPTYGDIVLFSKESIQLFNNVANDNNIALNTNINLKTRHLWFDKDKYEKILINLLSNAFKYTSKGAIDIDMLIEDAADNLTSVSLTVKDTGCGISKEDLPFIFDRFFHLTNERLDHNNDGTGIGLSLVKEFVKIHKGDISVESEFGKGTVFHIELSLNNSKDAYKVSNDETLNKLLTDEINLHQESTSEELHEEVKGDDLSMKPSILIVEDDLDLRKYLIRELNDDFNILEADNGKSGLDIALNSVLDLIISDLSMPEMDGIAMVEQIKKDDTINHIPIILLTAYNSKPHLEKAFKIGVDDFITKPFSSDLLLLRINSILDSRRQLQEKFQKEFKVEGADLPTTSMDQAFLNKAMEVIENNLSNSHFSATDFAEEMNISRVHLYRKLKSLTNESVSGFVKMVRLKLSADLIKNNKMSIKEVAYTVGFSDPKYFSKCFKLKYGVKPSDYIDGPNNELEV